MTAEVTPVEAPVPPALLLVLEGASQSFKDGSRSIPIVHDVSFTVDRPQTVAILGPSGCGKSTILRMVSGMHPRNVIMPTSGTAKIDGQAVRGPHDAVLTVWQKPILPRAISVEAIVALPFRSRLWSSGASRKERKERVAEVIEAVGLTEHKKKSGAQLSGGQKQRVALAQTLVCRPRIMCLDEPFSALDPQTRADMQALVVKLWQQFPCVALFVTHDVSEALLLADRVVVLSTRPATVVADIEIDTPKPRDEAWQRSPMHDLLEQRILRLIRDAKSNERAVGSVRVEV